MKVLPMAIVLGLLIVSFQAPPTSAGAPPITYNMLDGQLQIETRSMSAIISSDYPSIRVSYSGTTEGTGTSYELSYTGLLLTNNTAPGISPQPGDYISYFKQNWVLSPPEQRNSPYYGSYITFHLDATLDMVKIAGFSPIDEGQEHTPPLTNPPAGQSNYSMEGGVTNPPVRNWGKVSVFFIVTQNSVESDDNSHFSIVGENEVKMNISVEIEKTLGTSNMVIIQHIKSQGDGADGFVLPDGDKPHVVKMDALPHTGTWMEKMNTPVDSRGTVGFSPTEGGESPALYSWLLSAVRYDSAGNAFTTEVNTFYAGDEDGMVIAFSYSTPEGTVSVLHDPSLEIVPEVIEQTLKYVMEHAVSIAAGVVSAAAISILIITIRVKKEKKNDSLNIFESPYFRGKT